MREFGEALKALRLESGLTQSSILERAGVYTDDASYRRLERGERQPDREDLIKLVVNGLEMRKEASVNRLLSLAGHGSLTTRERVKWELISEPIPPPEPLEPLLPEALPEPWSPPPAKVTGPEVISAVGVVSLTISFAFVGEDNSSFIRALASLLYGALYSVSFLLESAFSPALPNRFRAAIEAGGLMSVTCAVALAVDSRWTAQGSSVGFWAALALGFLTAGLQWPIASRLPSEANVPAEFTTSTAQAAHLKNTSYFVVVFGLYLLLPCHCIVKIQSEIASADHQTAGRLLRGEAALAGVTFCIPPLWLWALSLLILAGIVAMGARLLDRLRPAPRRNAYLRLYYIRFFLAFALCVSTLAWYTERWPAHIGRLDQAPPAPHQR